MFVRFRTSGHKLQASLVETRRVDGRVRHEHVAGLGSIETPPSVQARLAFWQRLHERLANLSNRVDPATQGKILGAVHARIPMVTPDEQRAVQLENAEADERFWTRFKDFNEETAAGHKALAATAEQVAANQQAKAADAAAKAAAAKERAERIRRGDDVPGGIGKPFTREDAERILRNEGIDPKECVRFSEVCDAFGFDEVGKILTTERDRAERAAVRALHRRINSTIVDGDQG